MADCALCGSVINPGDLRMTVTGDSGTPSAICGGCTESRPLRDLAALGIAALGGGE